MLFVPLVYTLATEEAERIGVDHVARMASSNDSAANSYGKLNLISFNYVLICNSIEFQSLNI